MMKKTIFAILIVVFILMTTSAPARAVSYGDGMHAPDGTYFVMYPFWLTADKITDGNGNTALDNMGIDMSGVAFKVLHYTGDMVYVALAPVGELEVDALDDRSSGLGDVVLGAGYFLPIKWADILPAIQFKIPTGPYDDDDAVNFGHGQWDIMLETYLFKVVGKWCYDAALKYWVRLENRESGWKPGNEFRAEGLVTYGFSDKVRFGPAATYVRGSDGEQDGTRFYNSALEKISFGGSAIYHHSPKLLLSLDVMHDVETKNSAEGTFSFLRISIPL